MRYLLFLLLLASGMVSANTSGTAPCIEVRIDRRVELAAVLARLAGYEEFGEPGIAAYDEDVAAHFGAFSDDPAVVLLRDLRERHGIGYGDTVSLALLANEIDWQPRRPLADWLPHANTGWNEDTASAVLAAMARFSKATQADAFFDAHAKLYRQATDQISSELAGILDAAWFATLADSPAADVRFIIIPALLHGRGNYGPRITLPDGTIEAHAVIGPPVITAAQPIAWPVRRTLRLLVHEFSHAFINPWVDAHASTLRPAATAAFDANRARMQQNAYGSWEIMTYESLVRAVTMQYFLDHGLPEEAATSSRIDAAQGFDWIPPLAKAISPRTDGVPLLAAGKLDAVTEVLHSQAMAKATRRAPAPGVVALLPSQDAPTLDPATPLLEIRFDRSMDGGMGIFGGDDHPDPEYTGKPEWNEDRTILRVPVRLQPDTEYRLELNHPEVPGGFQSSEGVPLAPMAWRFRTRG